MCSARLVELFDLSHQQIAPTRDTVRMDVEEHHLKHQLTFEPVLTATEAAHTPAAGVVTVSHMAHGTTAYIDDAVTVDLTLGAQTVVYTGSYDSLQISQANLDADCSLRITRSSYRI